MAALSITAGNVVKASGATTSAGTAGASITAGQVLYMDASDSNKLKLCDANASAAASTPVGIALHAAASGQPITYCTSGDLNVGATLTVGEIYVPGATAGEINPCGDLTAGWYTAILGVATTTTNLRVSINAPGYAHA